MSRSLLWFIGVVVWLSVDVGAQERLDLTTLESQVLANSYQVIGLHIDLKAPNIEVTLESDTGYRFVWRYIVSGTVTETDILNAIRFINRGDFVAQGKTLRQWILERIVALGVKSGTVVVP